MRKIDSTSTKNPMIRVGMIEDNYSGRSKTGRTLYLDLKYIRSLEIEASLVTIGLENGKYHKVVSTTLTQKFQTYISKLG